VTDKTECITSQKIFCNLAPEQLQILDRHSTLITFKTGQHLAKEDDPADEFYMLINGDLAIELHAAPTGERTLLTLLPGDLAGWSWIFPPYRWVFDVKARSDGEGIQFDAIALRNYCETDPAFGYALMRLFMQVMCERLKSTRIQLLDIYGNPAP